MYVRVRGRRASQRRKHTHTHTFVNSTAGVCKIVKSNLNLIFCQEHDKAVAMLPTVCLYYTSDTPPPPPRNFFLSKLNLLTTKREREGANIRKPMYIAYRRYHMAPRPITHTLSEAPTTLSLIWNTRAFNTGLGVCGIFRYILAVIAYLLRCVVCTPQVSWHPLDREHVIPYITPLDLYLAWLLLVCNLQ